MIDNIRFILCCDCNRISETRPVYLVDDMSDEDNVKTEVNGHGVFS